MADATRTVARIIKRSFAPVVNAGTRVLILGSLPGEVSLSRSQYYAHPRNQFWRLMEPIVKARLVDVAYELRLAALLSAGVGLWDVIRSARRSGSLDGDIRDLQPNALSELVATLPSLRLIAFNGAMAAKLGRKQLGAVNGVELILLPSSSPAHTASMDSKQLQWNQVRRFLARPGRARATAAARSLMTARAGRTYGYGGQGSRRRLVIAATGCMLAFRVQHF